MNPFYQRMHAMGQRMVAKYGANASVVRMEVPPHAPGDFPPDPVETAVFSGPVVVLPNNSELRKVFDALTNGPTVQIGEVQAYVSPANLSVEFKIGDRLTMPNAVYSVKNGIAYNPDGAGTILHILEVQKIEGA